MVPALDANAAPRKADGKLVIVFKDGHRQAFNLSDIERVEFPGATASADSSTSFPPRGRYFGKWEVGDGAGSKFTITLHDDGSAYRSLGDMRGHWTYTNGDALITWDDGAKDAIRRVGGGFQKFAYSAGKSFHDDPDNVTDARNASPRPI